AGDGAIPRDCPSAPPAPCRIRLRFSPLGPLPRREPVPPRALRTGSRAAPNADAVALSSAPCPRHDGELQPDGLLPRAASTRGGHGGETSAGDDRGSPVRPRSGCAIGVAVWWPRVVDGGGDRKSGVQ